MLKSAIIGCIFNNDISVIKIHNIVVKDKLKALCQGSEGEGTKDDDSRELEALGRAEGHMVSVAEVLIAVAMLLSVVAEIFAHFVALILRNRSETIRIVSNAFETFLVLQV